LCLCFDLIIIFLSLNYVGRIVWRYQRGNQNP